MRLWGLVISLLLLGTVLPAAAQTASSGKPVETVIVNGQKLDSDQVIDNFVKSYATPTAFLGRIARWDDRICPKVSGLKPEVNAYIVKRIKDVAVKSGARVDGRPTCHINIEIVFTPQPQNFMDDIRKNVTFMLGFHNDSSSQADSAAVVSHPVQAWYASQIVDYLGNKHPEEPYADCALRHPTNAQQACGIAYQSSLFGDGQQSTFTNVLVVADTNKVSGIAISPLADYVAMLALSRTQAFDTCQGLPTIANLMIDDCDASHRPTALSDADLAYLRALYAMEPGEKIYSQRGDIARRMEKDLTAH